MGQPARQIIQFDNDNIFKRSRSMRHKRYALQLKGKQNNKSQFAAGDKL